MDHKIVMEIVYVLTVTQYCITVHNVITFTVALATICMMQIRRL